MVLFMLLSIVACSGEGEPVQVPEEGQEQAAGETDEPEQSQETDSEAKLGSPFTTGPYEVTVNAVRRIKDYDGNPAIVVNYTWTNNSEETTSWMGSMFSSVFQDGVQLESAFVVDDMESDQSMKEVRPGTTLEGIEEAFEVSSENPLEIEVQAIEEMFSDPIVIHADFPEE